MSKVSGGKNKTKAKAKRRAKTKVQRATAKPGAPTSPKGSGFGRHGQPSGAPNMTGFKAGGGRPSGSQRGK